MDYQFEIIETEVQPALSTRIVTSVANLLQELGKAYPAIITYLNELGEQPAEAAAFAAFYNMDMERLEIEAGFPVAKKLPSKGELIASEIPAGKKATCLYKGPYKEICPVYTAMTKWINENGYQPTGVVYEFYYNSPKDVPESELLTKIMFLLK